MGYYIETTSHKNKANWIVTNLGGQIVTSFPSTIPPGKVPVVVMDNGPFEAAGIAYSQAELDYFTSPSDYRPKTFLLVPTDKVIQECPRVKSSLEW